MDTVDPLTEDDKRALKWFADGLAQKMAALNAMENPDAMPINWPEVEKFAGEILKWLVTGPCSPGYCLKLCAPGGKCEMPDCFTTCCGKNGHPCC